MEVSGIKIYPNQMWLDGFMASPFMARYGAEFNRPEWIDEAVKAVHSLPSAYIRYQDGTLLSCME